MQFKGARQVWHDAYAIHDKKGEGMIVISGGGVDPLAQMAHRVEAGKVIAIIEAMPDYDRSLGMFIYTSHWTKTHRECVRNHIYKKYIKKHGYDKMFSKPAKAQRFIDLLDMAIENAQMKDFGGELKFKPALMANMLKVETSNFSRDWTIVHDELMNMILNHVPKILSPLAKLVEEEKEKSSRLCIKKRHLPF